MNSSADKHDPESKVLLSEHVPSRGTPLYTLLLFFIALAFFSCFWMVPVPRPLYRAILVAVGAFLLVVMVLSAIRRTAVSFIYELTEDSLVITQVLWGHKSPYFSLSLADILEMDRLSAGIPGGKRKNACVTRLPACEKGIAVRSPSVILLIEPSESFARVLSRAAAAK